MTLLMKRPTPVPRRRLRLPSWLRWAVGLALLGTAVFYLTHRRQINRHARLARASLISRHLTGHEKTPLLDGYSVHGIDVSAYQGRIDWAEVASHDVQFAFIKATEGVTLRDQRFRRNWDAARKAGVYRGAYHYFQPNYDGAQQVL